VAIDLNIIFIATTYVATIGSIYKKMQNRFLFSISPLFSGLSPSPPLVVYVVACFCSPVIASLLFGNFPFSFALGFFDFTLILKVDLEMDC